MVCGKFLHLFRPFWSCSRAFVTIQKQTRNIDKIRGAKYALCHINLTTSKGMPLNTKHLPTETGESIDAHLLHTIGVDPANASQSDLMLAVAQIARSHLSELWIESQPQVRYLKSIRAV